MFSIGDKVYSNSMNMEGIVNSINGKMIDVYFEKYHISIGTERSDLIIIEKTTNQKELLRTIEGHKKSTNFSLDCDYEVIFTEDKLSITKFIEKLNHYRNPWTKELKYREVVNLLVTKELLTFNSNNTVVPTQKGNNNGIEREYCYIGNDEYRKVNYYNRFAQELVLKLILDSQYDDEPNNDLVILEEEKEGVTDNPFQSFYNDLLALRLSLKQGNQKLLYVIPESTLYELYLKMPISLLELYRIDGLAEKRIEKYGNQILEVINKYIELKDYEKPEVNREPDDVGNIGAPWSKEENDQLIEEINSCLTIKEISKIHQRTSSAIKARIKKINNSYK